MIVLGFLGFVLAIVAAVLLFVGISKLQANLIIPTIVLLVGLTILVRFDLSEFVW
jgi:hypothetical protein